MIFSLRQEIASWHSHVNDDSLMPHADSSWKRSWPMKRGWLSTYRLFFSLQTLLVKFFVFRFKQLYTHIRPSTNNGAQGRISPNDGINRRLGLGFFFLLYFSFPSTNVLFFNINYPPQRHAGAQPQDGGPNSQHTRMPAPGSWGEGSKWRRGQDFEKKNPHNTQVRWQRHLIGIFKKKITSFFLLRRGQGKLYPRDWYIDVWIATTRLYPITLNHGQYNYINWSFFHA